MSNKIKILLLLIISIVIICLGIAINLNEFSKPNTVSLSKKKEKIQNIKFELMQNEVTLQRGTKIDYKDYVKMASDEYGYDIKYKVKVPEKAIDTNKIGKYQVTYSLIIDKVKLVRKLVINIK